MNDFFQEFGNLYTSIIIVSTVFVFLFEMILNPNSILGNTIFTFLSEVM